MPPRVGSKIERGYATITEEDGVNYRQIAQEMSDMGFEMNHSSARNYVLRVMKKMAEALIEEWNLSEQDYDIDEISKSPFFQNGISDVIKDMKMVELDISISKPMR
jgi:hypothetical protein